ncbi:Holliday junction branch migration protein RuvA [Natribacillus halophilus]|uniref:Holliday junction branch migration complex subunit RuvA n=1 Tax=Natribacillus halophilus TaxID=549003 RepID=A0A1G8NXQ6_9BACI|nr:Holliday junction branch migration protein RuvA [Natribacillus halophilus]SDI85091.1 Holliday junction DNA helicase subunit RuvA [Natribacillus halophilus]
MIERLRGQVVFRDHASITLDVHGVGYLIQCANPFVYDINEDKETLIYTYQHVREDAIHLYGFSTREERELFSRLLQVSGIGPKGGLAILAEGNAAIVVQAIEEEDETLLVKFPGIGKKTARQMILDLKGKFAGTAWQNVEATQTATTPIPTQAQGTLDEAMEALRSLGYGEKEIKKCRKALQHEELEADEYVRRSLRLLVER